MRNSDKNKNTDQSAPLCNVTTDTKGNSFNTSKAQVKNTRDLIKQCNANTNPNQLLDKKKRSQPYKVIDSSNKKKNKTKSLTKDEHSDTKGHRVNKDIGNNDNKRRELLEKFSHRTEYKTTSNSSKNIKNILENSIDLSHKLYTVSKVNTTNTNTNPNTHTKAKSKGKVSNESSSVLNGVGSEYKAKTNQRLYARSFMGKKKSQAKQQQQQSITNHPNPNPNNTSPSGIIRSKYANTRTNTNRSNINIKVKNPMKTSTKQLSNSKSNKTVKYSTLNTKSIKKILLPKTTINMKQDDDDKFINTSLEKENDNNITSLLYMLSKTNNFLSDSFKKFIDFFPLDDKADCCNVMTKKNEDITDTDLLHLVDTNQKILNWNLAKSELFFDVNMIYNNVKELKDKIANYQSSSTNKGLLPNDKESKLRVKEYTESFEVCYTSLRDIGDLLNKQLKSIELNGNNGDPVMMYKDTIINNNVDDLNANMDDVNKKHIQLQQHHNEDIFINNNKAKDHDRSNSNKANGNQIGNVNIISSVTNSNINVNVNLNLGPITHNNKAKSKNSNNINKKKSKRKSHQQANKKIITSKRKFKNDPDIENKGNGEGLANIISDDSDNISLGNDQCGIANCPKANLFNVQKPQEENMKYKLYTSNSDFESSERDEKSVSKIVIGEIECYKDIIEQDKIDAFKNMRSKSSFNIKGKRKRERNFDNYCILEDERQISDLDEEIWDEEMNQEEINDEFNDDIKESKAQFRLLPYHISKISFCKIFDEANGNSKVTENYQNDCISLPMSVLKGANKRKSLSKLRTTSKTFYLNDKQGLATEKNTECIIF